MGQVELSIVIPAYNEEDSIELSLGTLDKVVKPRRQKYEIVVVDDGSIDKTLLKATAFASMNGHVKVVSYNKNQGKGHAVKQGFMQTTGDIVIFADSDMDIDLSTISTYVDALENGDIAIASKWHPDSVVDIPVARRMLSHSFNVLVKILTGVQFKDTQAGLKAMRREAFVNIFPKLSVKRYAFDVELLAVARINKLRIVELPTHLTIKSLFSIKDVARMMLDLLGVAYRLRITHWYQRPITHQKREPQDLVLHIGDSEF
jgi:glycosyltransferase involved in cell wall biosynthesis